MSAYFLALLFVLVQCLPSAVAASESDNMSPETRMFQANGDGLALKRERTRFVRAPALPLGHRYIGLGKRLEPEEEETNAAPSDPEKRASYSVKEGGAMRFIGLGKRGSRVRETGLRFIGLGKRNPSAMRFIGLGKRIPSSGDESENVESEEIDDETQNYYANQEKDTRK